MYKNSSLSICNMRKKHVFYVFFGDSQYLIFLVKKTCLGRFGSRLFFRRKKVKIHLKSMPIQYQMSSNWHFYVFRVSHRTLIFYKNNLFLEIMINRDLKTRTKYHNPAEIN